MKKRRTMLLVGGMLILAVGLAVFLLQGPERVIFSFVLSHQEELEQFATDQLDGKSQQETYKEAALDGVFSGDFRIVQFSYRRIGLVPSSSYYGFYYSPSDQPAAYQNTPEPLHQTEENCWEWSDETDNGGLTKRIAPGWFYYEAWF